MMRMLACILAILATATALPAAAASAIEGRWQAVEYDPLIAENAFFGQFRYELVIQRQQGRLRIDVPRTGAVYERVRREGDRLIADGTDPARGVTRLDVTFEGTRFAGTVHFSSQKKRIEGQIDPADLASREMAEADSARRQARGAAEQLRDVQDANADLQQRLTLAEATLRRAELKIATLQRRLEEAASRPPPRRAAEKRSAPAPASGRPGIDIIEPPVRGGNTAAIPDRGQDAVTVIGRIRGAGSLLSLQANGRPLSLLPNGLFQLRLQRGALPAVLDVVAVDANGARTARSITVTLAGSPPLPSGTGDGRRKAAASPAATCYQLAIVADPPDPTGPEVCRAVVKSEPDIALNHYHLATALSRLGRHSEAVFAYREAAALWSRQ